MEEGVFVHNVSYGGSTARGSLIVHSAFQWQLHANPYLYDGHLAYVALLRREGYRPKIRSARERMAQCFPLTEELWLAWIQDEEKVATDEEGHVRVVDLYLRATKDYLCP